MNWMWQCLPFPHFMHCTHNLDHPAGSKDHCWLARPAYVHCQLLTPWDLDLPKTAAPTLMFRFINL